VFPQPKSTIVLVNSSFSQGSAKGPGALLSRAREVAAGPGVDAPGGEETPPGVGSWGGVDGV